MTEPMSEPGATCVYDLRAGLGEGPVWISSENAVYFVNINDHQIHRFSPGLGETAHWIAPNKVAFLMPADDGSFLAGLPDGSIVSLRSMAASRKFWTSKTTFPATV